MYAYPATLLLTQETTNREKTHDISEIYTIIYSFIDEQVISWGLARRVKQNSKSNPTFVSVGLKKKDN